MQWADVLKDRSLHDLPYKIELNEWGQIVMSPASNQHAYFQGEVYWILRSRMVGGKVLTECSVETAAGVKVPMLRGVLIIFFKNMVLPRLIPLPRAVCGSCFAF